MKLNIEYYLSLLFYNPNKKYATSTFLNTEPLTDKEYKEILESTLFTTDNLDNVKKLKNFHPEAYVTF